MPALPAGDAGAAELPSSAVAPPNSISRGPMYPGVPSSPTAATAVSVWPHLHPGPSSFFSMIAFTTENVGAGLGPAATACASTGGDAVPDAGSGEEVPFAGSWCFAAAGSWSGSAGIEESTSIARQLVAVADIRDWNQKGEATL